MASTGVRLAAGETESLVSLDGMDLPESLSYTVNSSDFEKEADEGSFDDHGSTLQWESTAYNSLSDDVKLATVAPDGLWDPPELDQRLFSDEGLGTLSSNNREDPPDGCQAENTEAQEADEENLMPEIASQVFVPSIHIVSSNCSLPQESPDQKKAPSRMYEAYEMEPVDPETQALLFQGPYSETPYAIHPCRAGCECSLAKNSERKPRCCGCQCCTTTSLKAVASFFAAIIIFPCFLYGAYVFLPFDVPLMPAIGTRLVYTVRCGVFATFPIIMGMIVHGIARLCSSSFDPFGKREREVEIHRRYVSQSVSLFVLYFFNLVVMATYLPQEFLKLVPLLTGLFALSRLIYWLAFAMGRSFRGFGYGLTFLPLVAMLLSNLYFMFIMEPQNMFAVEGQQPPEEVTPAPGSKLRMWG